jgi:hypothetical protein
VIKIANNDSNIIDKNDIVINIAVAMTCGKSILLTTNGEGPCAEKLGLYTILDNLCSQLSFPKNQVSIETCNLLESHPEYNIKITPQMYYLNSARQYSQTVNYTKVFDNNFKHFGSFIGHGNKYRLQLGSTLYAYYGPLTLQTYHCDVKSSYHNAHIGLEDTMFAGNFDLTQIKLLQDAPLTIDAIDSYPILNPATLNITKVYPDFFVELVSLTYFSGKTFYIDEKIWRPIIMRTPFMIQGPQNYISNLHRLGFKTFGDYWDEGYSQDSCNCHVPAMLENVRRLTELTVAELAEMYQEMQSILEHNYQRLMTITSSEFLL